MPTEIKMLGLKIGIEGKSTGDLLLALDEVRRLVEDTFLSGFDSNDSGRFSFTIEGKEE